MIEIIEIDSIAGVVHPGSRDAFGSALADLGRIDEKVVVLVPDCVASVRASLFHEVAPNRSFQFGIAEANTVGFAAGFAAASMKPFVVEFAAFLSMRAYEQVRQDISFPKLNVKLVGTHSGLSPETDGPTHHALEDIAIMHAMVNMTVIAPADSIETKKITNAIHEYISPVYMRIGRDDEPLVHDNEEFDFRIGEAIAMRDGNDVSIITTGVGVSYALSAAELLEEQGIEVNVINMHTMKPIDVEAIYKSATATGAIVTVEEYTVTGGLGGAVAEVLVEKTPFQ